MHPSYSLMIHGGAGSLERIATGPEGPRYLEAMRRVLASGRALLERGGSALDTAEHCVALLEDDPLFNAGKGSVLNELGRVEMDAALMDGASLSAGSVAAVSHIANPIRLARRVMQRSGHVMLAAEGAGRFAAEEGFARVADSYFLTAQTRQQWLERKPDRKPQAGKDEPPADDKHGTVGCVARDLAGNLAAATSTGGVFGKRLGRVGDSPIIGAGVYADNTTCAVSCTGRGEDILRAALAKRMADSIEFLQLDARDAVAQALGYFLRRLDGQGGAILIDRLGNCAGGHTTKRMIHGWVEHGGAGEVSF